MVLGAAALGQEGGQPQLRLDGPRDAFVSFRQALEEDGAQAAAGAVSFQGLSAAMRGPARFEIIRKLGDILDSDTWDTEDIPLVTEVDEVVVRVYSRADVVDDVLGRITLVRGTDGLWRFSPETVLATEAVWEVRVQPQLEPPATGSVEPGTSGQADGDAEPVPEGFASPRATLRTFFDAMNAVPPDYQSARSTLDLSEESPLVAERIGNQYATWIFGILNRTVLVDLDSVPDVADSDPYIIDIEVSEGQVRRLVGEIVLERTADGRWLFSTETLSGLDGLWAEVQALPTLEGLRDVQNWDNSVARWVRERLDTAWLTPAFGGLEGWQLIAVPVGVMLAYFVGVLFRIALKLFVRLRWRRSDDALNSLILRYSGNGIGLLLTGLLVNGMANQFGLPVNWRAGLVFLAEICVSVAAVLIAMAILELAGLIVVRQMRSNQERTERLVVPLIRNFGRALIVLAAIIYLFFRVGFDVSGLVAGLGVGSLIFALAAKDSIENVFGSLTVLFEMPFQIGDWVIVGDIEGTVETIALRSTRIRTFADSLILVPNSKFIATPLENMGSRRYRRIKTTIGITYDTPPDTIEEFLVRLRRMAAEHPHTWKEKMLIHFHDFGPSSLDIQLYLFVEAPTWALELDYREDILMRVVRIAEEMGVEFAFPTQTMILDGKNSKGSLGGLLKSD